MHQLSAKGFTINQAAGVRLVIRVVFNDLTLKNADEDFIEGETVRLGFLISVVVIRIRLWRIASMMSSIFN